MLTDFSFIMLVKQQVIDISCAIVQYLNELIQYIEMLNGCITINLMFFTSYRTLKYVMTEC